MVTAASTEAGPPEFVTAVEGIAEFRLDNGMKVLLFPDPSKPQVTVNLTVFVGSRHEGYGEAGMAHLLEHMLFKGTPDHPDVPQVLKDHGADYNGTTWLDRTNYFETLPASDENLEFALRLEADRMVNSNVLAKDLESEMTVVRNEFERGENSPRQVLQQRMMAVAYEWHNYGQSTIGNRADIERVPIENLREFYRKYYQPDNAMVIVAGQFDPQQALTYIDKYFGALPAPERKLPNTYTEEPAQDGEREVVLRRVGDVALSGLIYHICSGPHPDYVSVDVLENVLAGTPSGRLYKALVERKLASNVSGAAYALHDPGVLRILAEVAPGNDPYDILATMTEIVETIVDEGITEEEVERSKQYWLKEWELALADSGRIAVQLSEWAAQGDWRLLFLYRDRLEEVSVESVQAVAKTYLRRNNRTIGLFLPTQTAERVSIPPTPNLAEMIGNYEGREGIAVGEAFDVSPENIEARTERLELASGMKAALLPKKTRGESVRLRLTIRYGNLESLRGKAVACDVLPQLMLRGTSQLTRQQIQDELDKNRARIAPSGNPGEVTFSVETRRAFLPDVFNVLRQVLRDATLPSDELEIIKTQTAAYYESKLTDPSALAQSAIMQAINPYTPDDPRYAPTLREQIQRWSALDRESVAALYDDFLNGTHGELAIVGDFDPDETMPLVTAMLADWNSDQPYARIPRVGNVDLDDTRTEINTPDKENAMYFAATVIPMNDADPDYAPLIIGNDIFGGGGLASRLADRVRQKEGLSYGVGAFLNASALDERTTMGIYAITNPANMPKVETAIREELTRLLDDGVTADEVAAAVGSYLEQKKVERSDDGTLAAILAESLEADRDMGYYVALERQVAELTGRANHVTEVLRKRIDPKRITLVVAGDFEKARQEAAAAGE